MVIVRYPTGKSEFRIVAEAPAVGDVLEQGNDEWHVIDWAASECGRGSGASMRVRTTGDGSSVSAG